MADLEPARSALDRLVLRVLADECRGEANTSIQLVSDELTRRGISRAECHVGIARLVRTRCVLVERGNADSGAEGEHGAGGDCADGELSDDMRIALTERGRAALHRVVEAGQFNVRLPNETRDALRDLLPVSGGTSLSGLAAEALREWTRMQRFPGVDFRWSPMGRQAYASGTGLTVWGMHHLWVDHGRDVESLLANHSHLTGGQIARAVAYAEAHLYELPVDAFGVRPGLARVVAV